MPSCKLKPGLACGRSGMRAQASQVTAACAPPAGGIHALLSPSSLIDRSPTNCTASRAQQQRPQQHRLRTLVRRCAASAAARASCPDRMPPSAGRAAACCRRAHAVPPRRRRPAACCRPQAGEHGVHRAPAGQDHSAVPAAAGQLQQPAALRAAAGRGRRRRRARAGAHAARLHRCWNAVPHVVSVMPCDCRV